jgi:hypothetical protein
MGSRNKICMRSAIGGIIIAGIDESHHLRRDATAAGHRLRQYYVAVSCVLLLGNIQRGRGRKYSLSSLGFWSFTLRLQVTCGDYCLTMSNFLSSYPRHIGLTMIGSECFFAYCYGAVEKNPRCHHLQLRCYRYVSQSVRFPICTDRYSSNKEDLKNLPLYCEHGNCKCKSECIEHYTFERKALVLQSGG